MQPKSAIFIGLFAAFNLTCPAAAQAVPAKVTVGYGPAGLTWDAGFVHQGAWLTVTGPGGLRLTRRFAPGAGLTFSPVDDAGLPLPDGAYSFELHVRRPLGADEREIEAAGRQGGRLSPQEAQKARAVFEEVNGPFVIRAGGSFRVQAGQGRDTGRKEARREADGKTFTDPGSIMAAIGLAAGSTAASPATGELELIFDGTASVEQFTTFLEISAQDDRNDLVIDKNTGRVGIGTSVPAVELHIRGTGGTIAELAMDDPVSGQTYLLNQGGSGFWFNSSASPGVVKLQNAAPSNSLVVDASGRVGLGTPTPNARLHIFGVAASDVFNAVGPDPGSNGTALNFGYAGASFGLGAGFFNVRPAPGSTAPNPALYFATNNIDRLMVDNQGFIGVHLDNVMGPGFNPAHPIHAQTSGAFLSVGGVWTNASSRELKQDISPLTGEAAFSTLRGLQPVNFTYRAEPDDPHVGFIAEDVPDLVATPDRRSLAPMDVVAVLTRVVQEQQKTIEAMRERLERLEGERELKP